MYKIPLRNGQFSIVDKDDYIKCMMYQWGVNDDGYAYTTGTIYLHRHILNAKKGQIVDHINGDRLDNRRVNLRLVTAAQNSMNKKRRKDNTSGVMGVSWSKSKNKWIAYIHKEKKLVFLGSFVEKHDAITARTKEEQKVFGKYARQVAI